ncbi:MAG TPA: DNA polymerase/3'-5' exonuclease PolX [Candidatus Polarisedimenticolia bacterium]|nr:DNA polymerase/3'-5' exonuclease PolX [Candidatus Polarisedimenticolia bacterium]
MTPPPDRRQVAAVLEEVAALMDLKGENPFKSRAYQAAARTVESLGEDLGSLVSEGRLRRLKGIGPAIAEAIATLVTTGKLPLHEQLKIEIPGGLLEMIRIPGLGPRRAHLLHKQLGLASVEDLEAACRSGRLSGVAGFGAKSQEKILQGIAFLRRQVGSLLLSDATRLAEGLLEALRGQRHVARCALAGSLRRRKDVVRDVDLLASHSKGIPAQAVIRAFVSLPLVEQVLAAGDTKASILTGTGRQVDLRVVSEKEFPFALHYFTGSAGHNIALRRRAQALGMKINEYGLWKGARRIPCRDEEEIFARLGLAWIPPELREDWGEIEAAEAGTLPRLVEAGDLRGVLHVHSTWSDGRDSLEAMVKAATDRGAEFIGISDHSRTAVYAGGLGLEQVRAQKKEIEGLRRRHPGLTILHGTESDILRDGSLDYPAELLAELDFVIGSVHSQLALPEAEQTARVIKAIENPYLTCVGHPTGRLLLQRDGFAIDLERVLQAAAAHRKLVEVNASPNRLDLDWRGCRRARELGVAVSINPDAHDAEELADVAYGVDTARRGWLAAGDVANTRPWPAMKAMVGAGA